MSHKRHVWETVSGYLAGHSTSDDHLAAIEKQIAKLGREQFKANTLAESHAERLAATLETLQQTVARQEDVLQSAVRAAQLDILKALLPVLDGLEAGLQSGSRYAVDLHRRRSPETAALIAWLDGQRLLRDRLLALLQAEGIRPIPTIGSPFDPYRHVAVGTVQDQTLPDRQIVAEEQRGYAASENVLRYAHVVVVRNR